MYSNVPQKNDCSLNIPGKALVSGLLLSLIIFLSILFTGSVQAAPELLDSGTAGPLNFTVIFDESSHDYTTLTVSGTGEIPDYLPASDGSTAPWIHPISEVSDNLYRIMKLKLGRGITRIGDCAFRSGGAPTILMLYDTVTIPDTVVSIGARAFEENYFEHSLGSGKVIIPDSVVSIGEHAFEPEVIIVCSSTSAAYQYALKNGNTVELTDAPADSSQDPDDGNSSPKNYQITYILNKGTNHPDNPSSYTGDSSVTLKAPSRKQFRFSGWYTDPKFTNKVTVLKGRNYKVYAKWTKVTVGRAAAPTLRSPSKARLKISFKAVSKAKGYQVKYSLKKNFAGAKTKLLSKRSLSLKLKSRKTYYVRVRAYKIDSAGKKVWGAWSKAKKLKLK